MGATVPELRAGIMNAEVENAGSRSTGSSSTGSSSTGSSSTGFAAFYAANRADAVRWATALVGSRAVGEEIAQESLLAVGRRLDSLDTPIAYLRRTVVNRCNSWHRWHRGEHRRLVRSAAGQATDYTEPTNDMLYALGSLSTRQRDAVVLRYWADWTDEQIGDAIGCAPTTVRVLLHRGLAALKKEMA